MNQPVERRLAAILAADVAGYLRLMGADEEGTHGHVTAHIRERHCQVERFSQNTRVRGLSSCRVGRAAPLRRRLGSEDPKRRPGDEMALEVEGIVDGGMNAQKTLCRCR